VIGGYTKQFWKTAFTHRKQLRAIAAPAPPITEAFIGRVQGTIPRRSIRRALAPH
jgi:hypothetical protein